MHRIDRSSVPAPTCLESPRPGERYSDLRTSEKAEIRDTLLLLQKRRCAYCERRTGDERDAGHIEHFRAQEQGYAHLDRDWNNLFWSCLDEHTCGKHKDKCDRNEGPKRAFVPDQLVNPSEVDPELFLLFLDDGSVAPRPNLSSEEQLRAEETLRVFNLHNSPLLRTLRKDAIRPYKSFLDMWVRTAPEQVIAFVRAELVAITDEPFATAVKHFLESVIP